MSGSTVVVSVLADTGKFKQEMSGLGKTLGTIGAGFKLAVGAMGAALAAAGISQFGGEAVKASDATDKFKQTLNFAGIKPDGIDALAKSTRAYADQTVYSLGDIQSITAQLAANAVPNYDRLAEAAGNLNAVAGGNAETFKSVGMVLTQTAGAGKLTTENWNQLANAIPGASGKVQQALADAGAYTGNFRDAMAKGQITATEFNDALLKLGFDEVAVKAATSTTTIEGAWGNLEAVITGGLADIVTELKPFATEFMNAASTVIGPALTQLKDTTTNDVLPALKGFGQWFDTNLRPAFDQAATTLTTTLLPAFGQVADFVTNDVLPALEGFGQWATENKDYLEALAIGLAFILAPLAGFKLGIMLLGGAIQLWSSITKIAAAVQAAFNLVLSLNPIAIIVLAVMALVAALVYFFTQTDTGKEIWAKFTAFLTDSWKGFTEFMGKAWESIQKSFSDGVNAVGKFMNDAKNAIVNAWNTVMTFFNSIPGKVQAAFAAAGNWLVSSGTRIIDGLKSGVNSGWNAVTEFFGSIPGRITGALGNLGSLLVGAGEAILRGFLNGLKSQWSAVTSFVGGIADWIQAHKGPISYDKTLLKPAGEAIMTGFLGSLKNGWTDVQALVAQFAPGIADAIGGVAMASANGATVTVYQFGDVAISATDDHEASVLEEFAAMLQRKARAA